MRLRSHAPIERRQPDLRHTARGHCREGDFPLIARDVVLRHRSVGQQPVRSSRRQLYGTQLTGSEVSGILCKEVVQALAVDREVRSEGHTFGRDLAFTLGSSWIQIALRCCPTAVTSDRPSDAMLTPNSSPGPNVNCSGCPSGKRCRHRCEDPPTAALKYIHLPSGDHAVAVHIP